MRSIRDSHAVTRCRRLTIATPVVMSLLAGAATVGVVRPASAMQAQDTTTFRNVRKGRVVGVFDEASGDPVPDVEVKNLLNGLSAVTSRTGTLSLFFVDTAGALLSFKKVGYEPQ